MIRVGGRGQWFVLAMFTRAKMRQSEQYESFPLNLLSYTNNMIRFLLIATPPPPQELKKGHKIPLKNES